MSLCPVCGRAYCDHTPSERGQTHQEMVRDLTEEELEAFGTLDDKIKLKVAKRHAHDPVN